MSSVGKKPVSQRGSVPRGKRHQASRKKPQPKLTKSEFGATASLETLAMEQGVGAIDNLDQLRGDFWPLRESADEFINEIQRLRQQGSDLDLPR